VEWGGKEGRNGANNCGGFRVLPKAESVYAFQNRTDWAVKQLWTKLGWTWSPQGDPERPTPAVDGRNHHRWAATGVRAWHKAEAADEWAELFIDWDRASVKASQTQGQCRPWPWTRPWAQCPCSPFFHEVAEGQKPGRELTDLFKCHIQNIIMYLWYGITSI
jgi:hypothetical protein